MSRLRLYLACLAFSTWLLLLLCGLAAGGWVHLGLAAALVLFPWRAVVVAQDASGEGEED